MSDMFTIEQVIARLDHIQELADALAKAHRDFVEQQEIAERLHREIALARAALESLTTRN